MAEAVDVRLADKRPAPQATLDLAWSLITRHPCGRDLQRAIAEAIEKARDDERRKVSRKILRSGV